MKFFVYGKLKTTESKRWMLPFAKSTMHIMRNLRMYLRPTGAAGAKWSFYYDDFVVGQIREVPWAKGLLGKLLLLFLDLNEGTFWGLYERVQLEKGVWTYLYCGPVEEKNQIYFWSDNKGINYANKTVGLSCSEEEV